MQPFAEQSYDRDGEAFYNDDNAQEVEITRAEAFRILNQRGFGAA